MWFPFYAWGTVAQRNCVQKVPLIYKTSLRCLGPKASTPYCYIELFQLRSSYFQLCLWAFITSANSNASSQWVTQKMKNILLVTTCKKPGLNYYNGNFMARKDRILLSRPTSNYLNHSFSFCNAVPFFSAFLQNSSPNEPSSVQSSDSSLQQCHLVHCMRQVYSGKNGIWVMPLVSIMMPIHKTGKI